MRPVYKKRHRFNWKDLIRISLVTLGYYLAIIFYTSIFMVIRWAVFGGTFFVKPSEYNWWLIYGIVISPGINAIAHLIYSETGWLNYKAFIWIHSVIVAIVIPLIIFIWL